MQELCDRQGTEEIGAAFGSYAGGGGVITPSPLVGEGWGEG